MTSMGSEEEEQLPSPGDESEVTGVAMMTIVHKRRIKEEGKKDHNLLAHNVCVRFGECKD